MEQAHGPVTLNDSDWIVIETHLTPSTGRIWHEYTTTDGAFWRAYAYEDQVVLAIRTDSNRDVSSYWINRSNLEIGFVPSSHDSLKDGSFRRDLIDQNEFSAYIPVGGDLDPLRQLLVEIATDQVVHTPKL